MALTISCTPSATSTRRRISIGAPASQSARSNRHPWGTHNRIVQLQDFFVELLEIAEPEKIVPHGGALVFVWRLQSRFSGPPRGPLDAGLESRDAASDAERSFEAPASATSTCSISHAKAKRPDGSPVKLAFSLAFAADPVSPDTGVLQSASSISGEFLESGIPDPCQWREGVPGVVMVADNPAVITSF